MADKFLNPVKSVLAKRAAYRCSFPNCGQLTIGPQLDGDGIMNTGVAAHIRGASPGGARYDASLSRDERRSAENGIWMCSNHAKLIDSDEGAAHSGVRCLNSVR